MAEAYASGNWHVTEGKDDAFVESWTELLQWTRKTQPGFVRAVLIRHDGEPRHFISIAEWESASQRDAWKATPEFGRLVKVTQSFGPILTVLALAIMLLMVWKPGGGCGPLIRC